MFTLRALPGGLTFFAERRTVEKKVTAPATRKKTLSEPLRRPGMILCKILNLAFSKNYNHRSTKIFQRTVQKK